MRVFLSLAQNLPPQSRYRLLKTVNEYIVINDYTEKISGWIQSKRKNYKFAESFY